MRHLVLALGLILSSCATPPPVAVPRGPIALAVAQRGWHTEIGVPETALTGPLATLGPARLHRHYLLIGYGARYYFTGHHSAGTAVAALLPGPAAINLSAFDDLAADPARKIIWLHVSQSDIDHMLAFIWQSLPRAGAATPPVIASFNNASMFYAAQPDYNMFYNCNNWAVDALRAAGLPFSNTGLHYASDVQAQAGRIAAAQGP